ncbi:Hpt domain-containing protein [Methyloversatilis discipulorum]|uniref:Hpt domain-containing protein n=1 Tax=Methyloversatilis discipulorum TaxID=1119528 RepID=UPI003BBDD677
MSPPPAAPPVLDDVRLTELQDMLGPVIDEVLRAWLQDTPRTLQTVYRALHHGELGAAICAVHALKGSCSNVGAASLSASAQALECALREGGADCSAATIAVAQLDGEYDNAARLITARFRL